MLLLQRFLKRSLTRKSFFQAVSVKFTPFLWTLLSGGTGARWATPGQAISGEPKKQKTLAPKEEIPDLIGLHPENYRAFGALCKVLLGNTSDQSFDPALALDRYLYRGSKPLELAPLVELLIWMSHSSLVAFLLDFSLTPLVRLPRAEMEERLNSWMSSRLNAKRAAYKALRQTAWLMISSNPEYVQEIGYSYERPIRIYRRPGR